MSNDYRNKNDWFNSSERRLLTRKLYFTDSYLISEPVNAVNNSSCYSCQGSCLSSDFQCEICNIYLHRSCIQDAVRLVRKLQIEAGVDKAGFIFCPNCTAQKLSMTNCTSIVPSSIRNESIKSELWKFRLKFKSSADEREVDMVASILNGTATPSISTEEQIRILESTLQRRK